MLLTGCRRGAASRLLRNVAKRPRHPIAGGRTARLLSSGTAKAEEEGRLLGVAMFLSLAGFTSGLGYWQLVRRQWKIDLIETRTKNLQEPPRPLEDILRERAEGLGEDDTDFCQVSVVGKLDYENELIVGPRSAPEEVDPRHAGRRGGYYLLTPMELESGERIIVNRGWIRADLKDTIQLESEASTQLTKFTGVIRDGETPSNFLPMKSEARNWLYIDPDAMMQQITGGASSEISGNSSEGTILLDALTPENPQGKWPARKSPKSYVSYHTTPQLHSVYAATWFSLAAAIVGLTFVRFRRTNPAIVKQIRSKTARD